MTALQTLARDHVANAWVDSHVSEPIVERLRSWCRTTIDKCDPDDQAQVGVLLTQPCRAFDSEKGLLPKRAHIYVLVFTWDEWRDQKAVRAALYVNDANEVIDFEPIDKE
jgi:hypothetical protein